MTTYFISGGSDGWTKAKATTLLGAKREATSMYQASHYGKIEVAQMKVFGCQVVAVKYSHGKWLDFPASLW